MMTNGRRSGAIGLTTRIALYGWSSVQAVLFIEALDFVAGDGVNVWFGTAQVLQQTAVIALIATLVVAPIFFSWIYRAMSIARELAPSLTITPGWAVGWFFVPIASLFKPFEVLSEIVEGSGVSAPTQAGQARALIGWWWGCWMGRAFCSLVSQFTQVTDNDTTILTNGSVLMLAIASGLGVVAAIVFASIIRQVGAMQDSAVDPEIFA